MVAFKRLKQNLLDSGELFEDEDFPAADTSIFYKRFQGDGWDNIEWKRPKVSLVHLATGTFRMCSLLFVNTDLDRSSCLWRQIQTRHLAVQGHVGHVPCILAVVFYLLDSFFFNRKVFIGIMSWFPFILKKCHKNWGDILIGTLTDLPKIIFQLIHWCQKFCKIVWLIKY